MKIYHFKINHIQKKNISSNNNEVGGNKKQLKKIKTKFN